MIHWIILQQRGEKEKRPKTMGTNKELLVYKNSCSLGVIRQPKHTILKKEGRTRWVVTQQGEGGGGGLSASLKSTGRKEIKKKHTYYKGGRAISASRVSSRSLRREAKEDILFLKD